MLREVSVDGSRWVQVYFMFGKEEKNKLLLAKKETVEFTHDPFTDS